MVWVFRISGYVEQDNCSSFIRSSIIALVIPHKYIQYNQKIIIYPHHTCTPMVIEYKKGRGNFCLSEIFKNKFQVRYKPVDIAIFTTAVLQSYGEVSIFQATSNTIVHIYMSEPLILIKVISH